MNTAQVETSKLTSSDWKYPLKPARREGYLSVDTDPAHQIFWAEYGNPSGEPIMFLHGGPGGGCEPRLSQFFDPDRYRVILFDQRGCGKSTPNVASDGPGLALRHNTTNDLVDDILKLRDALQITGKMHVFGGSWGSTLAMAYAIKYPATVETLILRGIFLGRVQDLLYMYQGNAQSFEADPYGMSSPGSYISYPEAWRAFVEVIPADQRGDMMGAYKALFDMNPTTEAQRALQMKAAVSWSVWEGAISNLVPDLSNIGKFKESNFAICFAQIEAHYFANNLFFPENYLIDNVPAFAHIPVHIVHGRFDQVCPLTQAEMLVRALENAGFNPASYIKTTAGHSMLERENYLALVRVMDGLPKM